MLNYIVAILGFITFLAILTFLFSSQARLLVDCFPHIPRWAWLLLLIVPFFSPALPILMVIAGLLLLVNFFTGSKYCKRTCLPAS